MSIRENLMSRPILEHLRSRGFTEVYEQVPVFHCIMDIYGAKPGARETAAVEMKVADWRRGARQARVYQLCADFVYVAIHERYAHRVPINELRKAGLGLLVVSVDGQEPALQQVTERLSASLSSIKRDHYAERLLKDLEARDG